MVCLACPAGTRGNLCDACEDGYHHFDPETNTCSQCDCSGNIDENAIGNCDPLTGHCLRCIHNTTSAQCDRCLPGYWGDALGQLKCHACECHSAGSAGHDCQLEDGQCECKPNVMGRRCDECMDTFWNLASGQGCLDCGCSPLGSVDLTCDKATGQCPCQPGVQGLKCDTCMENYYNFSGEGCKACECHGFGSVLAQCDELGRCMCRENVGGAKCDRCEENYSNFTAGCVRCDSCYDLVKTGVDGVREGMRRIEEAVVRFSEEDIGEKTKEMNRELKVYMDRVNRDVEALHASLFSGWLSLFCLKKAFTLPI